MTARGRSRRDWVVDSAFFAAAVVGGFLSMDAFRDSVVEPYSGRELAFDWAVGAACCLALWLRRRWPVAVAVAMLLPAALTFSGAIAYLVAVFTVGVHRRTTTAVVVTVANLGAALAFPLFRPPGTSTWRGRGSTPPVSTGGLRGALFFAAPRRVG